MEADGGEGRFILGLEESYGYLSGTYVRDKDGVNASLLICEMAGYYSRLGMTLEQVLENLYQRYGYYLNTQYTCTFSGGRRNAEDGSTNGRNSERDGILSGFCWKQDGKGG
ncbi:MAG: hypothetical protein ACLTBV_09040 [Enterocloster bolteae]